MESKIKKIITTECELLVSPSEKIVAEDGYVYLEFVVGENIDCYENAEVSSVPQMFRFPMDDDGLFMYYRLKIYTKSLLQNNTDKKFYYDDMSETPRLMLGDIEICTSKDLENVANNADKTEYSIIDVVEEPVFSICRLNYCLTEYQKEFIFNGFSKINSNCKSDTNNEFARNFLFSTVFVLRQLIRQQRYEEALRILKSVSDCNGLCTNTKSSSKKCNCCK